MYKKLNDLPIDSHKYYAVIAKSNSRITNHYWYPEDKYILDKLKKNTLVKIILPNSQSIHSIDKGILSISKYLSKIS